MGLMNMEQLDHLTPFIGIGLGKTITAHHVFFYVFFFLIQKREGLLQILREEAIYDNLWYVVNDTGDQRVENTRALKNPCNIKSQTVRSAGLQNCHPTPMAHANLNFSCSQTVVGEQTLRSQGICIAFKGYPTLNSASKSSSRSIYGGFLKNRGTPSYHPFKWMDLPQKPSSYYWGSPMTSWTPSYAISNILRFSTFIYGVSIVMGLPKIDGVSFMVKI